MFPQLAKRAKRKQHLKFPKKHFFNLCHRTWLFWVFNLWTDRFSSLLPVTLFQSSPLPPVSLSLLLYSSSLLPSLSPNKPIAESLCSSTLRLTSVSALRERNREVDGGRGEEEGARWVFLGASEERKMRRMNRACFIWSKRK